MKLRRLYFFILSAILSSGLCAQSKTLDSLKQELKKGSGDSARCLILNSIIEKSDNDQWPFFNVQLNMVAEKALKTPGLTPSLKKYYLDHLANSINNFGTVSYNKGDISQAVAYYKKSLKMFEETGNEKQAANSVCNLGVIFENRGNISEALEFQHKGLKLREKLNDKPGIANSLNAIGYIYHDVGELSKALEYYQKALSIREEIKDNEGIATSLANLGAYYYRIGNADKALEYSFRSLKKDEELNNKSGVAHSFANIGRMYNSQGKSSLALEYYEKGLAIYEELGNKAGIVLCLNHIISFNLAAGKIEKAFELSTRAMSMAKELGFPVYIQGASGLLYKIYKQKNMSKEALAMHELFVQMSDSINNTENRKISAKQQFKYEFEKKELAYRSEQEKKDIIHADQSKNQKIIIVFVISGLLMAILFALFLLNRFKITQKQKRIIENQKLKVDEAYDRLHEKNKEVMDSITYALRIQRALLPNESYINKHLNRLANKNKA